MSKILMISAVFCLFILFLFSCSKSPPEPNIPTEIPQSYTEQVEILQEQLASVEQQALKTVKPPKRPV